ncbi:hypothetical protein [Paenibacillus xylanexedens]|uniref:hypothetical protein n=1 Tax=Paenibacillus xylanexedens TaxID=528191 RepID=UPI001C92D50B|nr:hypothetical protein [Paenibacillus xylanexedens]
MRWREQRKHITCGTSSEAASQRARVPHERLAPRAPAVRGKEGAARASLPSDFHRRKR